VTVYRMINPVMAYAWGSRDSLANLQGRKPTQQPEAELWMGAHPHASSLLEPLPNEDGTEAGEPVSLEDAIAAEPQRFLGDPSLAAFGARLPFLLKVIAAADPLSLQVHPDNAQAKLGYEIEDADGIDRSAPNRSYRDPYAKPEMIVALTRFEALQGFRPANEAIPLLEGLAVEPIAGLVEELRAGLLVGEAFLRLVEWPADQRADLVRHVLAGARAARVIEPLHSVYGWVESLATRYPTDPGVLAPALLNYAALEPGHALLVSPGQIHAYLYGTGVEILGASDNVIRGGLTPKHVSVAELRSVLDVESRVPTIATSVSEGGAEEFWRAPFQEFELSWLLATSTEVVLRRRGPEVIFCASGSAQIADDADQIGLGPGESAFATATGGRLRVGGAGVLMRATPRRRARNS
jgi:mannose-6-phosphate isomerase